MIYDIIWEQKLILLSAKFNSKEKPVPKPVSKPVSGKAATPNSLSRSQARAGKLMVNDEQASSASKTPAGRIGGAGQTGNTGSQVKRANYFVAQQDSSSDDDSSSSDSTDSEPWMSKGSVRRKTISFEAVPVLKVWHRTCLVFYSHQGPMLWNFLRT